MAPRSVLSLSIVLCGALACSREPEPELEDPGPGCTADPGACPAGTTCWPVDVSGKFDCLSAPAAQSAGSPCAIDLGIADCASGLFCYPTAPASGVCSPFCTSWDDCGGSPCNDVFVNEAAFRYEVRVCAAAAPADAGAD
jgi:hypothetical protein